MTTPIIIYGSRGRVGSELLRYIYEMQDRPFRVVGVVESDAYCLDPDGLMDTDITYTSGACDIQAALQVCEDKRAIIVDATAAKDTLKDIHLHIMRHTPHTIVTANKNPLSLYQCTVFDQLVSDARRYSCDTTVMAGTGVIPFLQDRVAIGDMVRSIQGIFSGTLGYIFSTFEKGEKSFSQIVREAHKNGYTEPHPYDDLGGVDVARKLLIIARMLGHKVELSDIHLTPLVASDIYDPDVETFLANCERLDEDFDHLRQGSRSEGKTLRYVASYSSTGKLSVGLQRVDIRSALGQLSGTHNIARIETDAYEDPYPHIIQSRGAGVEVTAYSLLAQIMRICDTYQNS